VTPTTTSPASGKLAYMSTDQKNTVMQYLALRGEVPGVPAAGHLQPGKGYWHPGRKEGCPKCEVAKPMKQVDELTHQDFRYRPSVRAWAKHDCSPRMQTVHVHLGHGVPTYHCPGCHVLVTVPFKR
jgi:hypothetical protein